MPRKTDSNNPADWLYIAESDLHGIQVLIDNKVSHGMCSSKLAEVLEKIIKAELIRSGWILIKTHDLVKLADELREKQPELAEQFQPFCESFAERYFTDRYPGFDIEDEDWQSMSHQADEIRRLLNVVKAHIDSDSPSLSHS